MYAALARGQSEGRLAELLRDCFRGTTSQMAVESDDRKEARRDVVPRAAQITDRREEVKCLAPRPEIPILVH